VPAPEFYQEPETPLPGSQLLYRSEPTRITTAAGHSAKRLDTVAALPVPPYPGHAKHPFTRKAQAMDFGNRLAPQVFGAYEFRQPVVVAPEFKLAHPTSGERQIAARFSGQKHTNHKK